MSNLKNTTRLPLQTSMTNKRKFYTSTNDLLERQTRALENNLHKLKLQNKTKPTIETYRRIKDSRVSHDNPSVDLLSTKSSIIKQIIKCGQCEKDEAKMKCVECVEMYCANCFAHFHLRGALQRHHCILLSENQLSTFEKKKQSLSTDINLKVQSNEDLHRKSTMKSDTYKSEEILNEKSNFVSFQQSFLQWREKNIIKSKHIRTIDRIDYPNTLPNIEFNSSKTISNEKLLSKKSQNLNQRSKQTNITKTDVLITTPHSLSDQTVLNDPNIDIKPFDDDLSTGRTAESVHIEENSNNDNNNFEQNEEQERPIAHVSTKSFSRPTGSSIKKDSITLFQQSLRSVLTTKSNDELEAIVDSRLILSRPSSSTSEKLDQPPIVLNRNWIHEQTTSNNSDVQSITIDQYPIAQIDLPLDNLFDVSKTELTNRLNHLSEKDQFSTHVFCINSATTTPRRNSPFSFSNLLNKTGRINSASSRDTGDDGFFTDILPRQMIPSPKLPPPPPPPILECSTSNEWKHALENQSTEQHQTIPNSISLRRSSVESLRHVPSKHSVTHEETHRRSKSQMGNNNRSESSLSSSSLPVSITSSKPDFINRKAESSETPSTTSTTENSSSSTLTSKNSPSSTSKSPPTTTATKKSSPSTSKTSSSNKMATKTSLSAISTSKNSSSSTSASKNSSSSTSTSKKSSSSTSTLKNDPLPKPTTKSSSPSTSKTSSSTKMATKTPLPATTTSEKSSSSISTLKNDPSLKPTIQTSPPPTSKTFSSEKMTTETPLPATSKKPSLSASTPENVPSSKPTMENSSLQPEIITSMIVEDKRVISPCNHDESLQVSMDLLKDKSSFNVHTSQNLNDELKPSPVTFLTRDKIITEDDLPSKKRTRRLRQTIINDELSKFRKLEFSVGDGLKWREASTESMSSIKTTSYQSSNVTTPRSLTPSNTKNTEFAQQFTICDNDDGRSSRKYQNVNDEEYFHQLRQEICSELAMISSDEDAILNEQILNILQGVQLPSNEKDSITIETKLPENETVHQSSTDNELLIHT